MANVRSISANYSHGFAQITTDERAWTPIYAERNAMDDKPAGTHGSDEHMGAVEGDKATDPQAGNANVDEHGKPKSKVAVCEDVLGANADGTEG